MAGCWTSAKGVGRETVCRETPNDSVRESNILPHSHATTAFIDLDEGMTTPRIVCGRLDCPGNWPLFRLSKIRNCILMQRYSMVSTSRYRDINRISRHGWSRGTWWWV
jgi:hypothetical protein